VNWIYGHPKLKPVLKLRNETERLNFIRHFVLTKKKRALKKLQARLANTKKIGSGLENRFRSALA
jgi:hypothetical protein